jgi:hypothetical protein
VGRLYFHALDEVTWEAWSVGGEVDPKEADYDLDAWVEPIDHEAAVASEASGVRWERGNNEGEQRDRDGEARPEDATSAVKRGDDDGGGGSGRTCAR